MTITEQELESIRAEQEKYMPARIRIERDTEIAEDEPAVDVIERNVPARITPGFGFFKEIADRLKGITAFTITMPVGRDIIVNDRIIDETTGQVFHVRDVRDHKSYHTALQVLGDRVK